ncbi:hypothetical protein ACU4GD_33325 [Cupriavidus basilensis]
MAKLLAEGGSGAQGHHHAARLGAGRDPGNCLSTTSTRSTRTTCSTRSPSCLAAARRQKVFPSAAMSTGASNDFERATKAARDMVTRFGMSDTLGTMVYVDTEQDGSVRQDVVQDGVGSHLSVKVDAEIRRIVDEQYGLAKRLLEENRDTGRGNDRGPDGVGNHRRGPGQRHHGRQAAAAAAWCLQPERWWHTPRRAVRRWPPPTHPPRPERHSRRGNDVGGPVALVP